MNIPSDFVSIKRLFRIAKMLSSSVGKATEK